MSHAYGPADEVPDLLRELVSEDPAVRESALDEMYGAVHHQGDVYECTVASIPFLLEAAALPDLPGRSGIVQLLASIGGADWDEVDDGDEAGGVDDVESPEDSWGGVDRGNYRRAHQAVAAAYPLFVNLLADADPAVREAAPTALLACRAEAAGAVAALRERLPVEPDTDVRAAIVKSVGTLGRRAAAGRPHDVDAEVVGDWLAALVAGHYEPALRLAALAELARCAPGKLPPNLVPTALELLDHAYAEDASAPEPAGFSTDTLVGALRELGERERAGRRSPHGAELVSSLSHALGERVDDRI